jgi:peptide/nickel transport system substrate-binding protein
MGYADIIDNVEIISDYVVRFNLHIAFAPFLQLMSCAASYMVHPDYAPLDHFVEYTEGDVRGSHPNGLGPFILANWTRVGGEEQQMRLEKNPNYWNGPTYPKADVIIIQFYSSDTALTSAMAAGDIDIAYRHMSAAQIDAFRENADVRVWDGIGAAIQYMCFQQNTAPFDEVDIRQGIAAALNKSHVCETVFLGNADPLETIVPDGMAYHRPSFEIYGTGANYTHTVAMLALHGYNTGNKLEFDLYYESSGHYPQSAEQAAVYKSDLEASGVITVNLKSLEWSAYRTQRNAGTMPVYVYGWYPDYIDADNYAFLPLHTPRLAWRSTISGLMVAAQRLTLSGRQPTTSCRTFKPSNAQ